MEFVAYGEAMDLLREQGIREFKDGDDRVCLDLDQGDDVVHLHLACAECTCPPRDGADVLTVNRERLPGAVDLIIKKLNMTQLLLIPVSKWRKVFDAVAFSMAHHEEWQTVDATATVELNTRDPLLCEPGDFHTVSALIQAFFCDAHSPDQGLMLTTPSAPLMVELVPEGALRISVGNPVMADELAQRFRA